eukprot:CAMPEP_0203851268 /NCGR_PEP_ID=MMETSP0359-20131031/7253_1 /ASSEMBLY_ACC=CAM_ASM_000338 /TAXON_ID=268821 /ORGANISM="Scrippsiella Hangoei, Strain SHTV-5" /LENGTH=133 /DNA_ID=CAMNT_0050767271 /DNA_START=51 /DNA_END=453 /DNA_ORIENTATION=-
MSLALFVAAYTLLVLLPSPAQGADVVAAATAAAAAPAREGKLAQRREDHWQGSYGLLHALQEAGGGMGQCLSGCMTNNPMVLEMMLKMMPSIPLAEKNASDGEKRAPTQADDAPSDLRQVRIDPAASPHFSDL